MQTLSEYLAVNQRPKKSWLVLHGHWWVSLEFRQSRTLDAYIVLVTIFRLCDHRDESGTSSSGVGAYVTPNIIIVYDRDTHIHPLVFKRLLRTLICLSASAVFERPYRHLITILEAPEVSYRIVCDIHKF
jgi:hypothetical protein